MGFEGSLGALVRAHIGCLLRETICISTVVTLTIMAMTIVILTTIVMTRCCSSYFLAVWLS